MTFPLLLIAFIVVPVVEITLLIKVGSAIGIVTTILVVIFTAVLGAYLVKQQGFATLHAVQKEMNEGRVPALQMAEGIALLLAGAVLLTPGFMTDAVGFALLTPVLRRGFINWLISRGIFSMPNPHTGGRERGSKADSSAIEGEYSERD
jgi:UPF0716 protein FxsA